MKKTNREEQRSIESAHITKNTWLQKSCPNLINLTEKQRGMEKEIMMYWLIKPNCSQDYKVQFSGIQTEHVKTSLHFHLCLSLWANFPFSCITWASSDRLELWGLNHKQFQAKASISTHKWPPRREICHPADCLCLEPIIFRGPANSFLSMDQLNQPIFTS